MTDWKPEKYGYKFESYEKPYREDTPWPCMRGNIKNSGQLFESHSAHSQGGINETIHFRTGNAIFSTPVIGKDDIIYIGSADHKFYAMDPHKKEILWEDELAEIIDSAACIGKDRTIYIAAADAKIHAYTIEGKKKWVYDVLHDRPKHQFSLSTNFWYEANITLGPDGAIYVANDDFFLYKMTTDGEIIWGYRTGFLIWSAPSFWKDGTVYIAGFDHFLYAIDMNSGELKWKTNMEGALVSSPAIGKDGTIYQGSFNGNMYAVDHKTHKIKWKFKSNAHIYPSAAVADDNTVYFGSSDGTFYALEGETGEIKWTYYIGEPIRASASIGPDVEEKSPYLIYFGGGNGIVYAIDPQGKIRWMYDTLCKAEETDYPNINASIALGNSGLCVASSTGDVIWIPYNYYQKENAKGITLKEQVSKDVKGMKWHYVSPGGKFEKKPLEDVQEIHPINTISLRLLRHTQGRMLPVDIDPQSIECKSDPLFEYRIELQSDNRTIHIIPNEILEEDKIYEIHLSCEFSSQNSKKGFHKEYLQLRTKQSQEKSILLSEKEKIRKIQHMAIPQPTIVPSLNQIGFASLTIPFRIIESDPASGKFVAWAVQKFGEEGVPQKRISYYGFNGKSQNNYFLMEATNCLFEITAFNVPLNLLRIAGSLKKDGTVKEGSSLIVEKHWKSILSMISEMGGNNPLTLKKMWNHLKTAGFKHFFKALFKFIPALLRQTRSWEKWGLTNHENNLIGIGTFKINSEDAREEKEIQGVEIKDFEINLSKRKIIAEVKLEEVQDQWKKSIGIFIMDRDKMKVVPINYSSILKTKMIGNVAQTILKIPRGALTGYDNLRVYLLIDLWPLKYIDVQ